MNDVFHGTRRRAGVFTLVVASLLTAAWMRSLVEVDYFELPVQIYSIIGVGSERQSIVLFADRELEDPSRPSTPVESEVDVQTQSEPISQPQAAQDSGRFQTLSTWDDTEVGGQLAPISITISCAFARRLLEIPYWSIVVPLTLISAYLLLGRTTTIKLKEE